MRIQSFNQTFIQAIKNNNFITWPGLTTKLIRNLAMPTATSKGHLDQERKNLQSTQPILPPISVSALPHPDTGLKTMNSMVSLLPVNRSQKAFSDLTGRFPHKSTRGHEYVFVLYHYDSNAIFAKPVKNR